MNASASSLAVLPAVPEALAAPMASPPPGEARRPAWQLLFGDVLSALLTAATVGALILTLPKLFDWAVAQGVWSAETGKAACRSGGACWAFLREKCRFVLFGIYPPDQHWRPTAVIAIILALGLASTPPRFWGRGLVLTWIAGLAVCLVLVGGGVLGLAPVPTSAWGGLPVTLLLAVISILLGFPLAVALAVGRRSKLPVVRLVSLGTIEIIRGLPLVSLLFVASILVPLFLPEGLAPDKLARALIALTIFAAAYLAEVIRGGLQGIPNGQYEAAQALGLSWYRTMRQIILPQALMQIIPPLTNTLIVMVKNTSLVLVVGLFDLLSAGRAAASDPMWPAPYTETYLFIAAIYFVICFSISRYSRWLEERMASSAIKP
jgi:general L-amino acid transport system permease protein